MLNCHPRDLARRLTVILLTSLSLAAGSAARAAEPGAARPGLYSRDNLVAWCIVPFDSAKRSPEDRAAMLERLGLRHYAYDWRAEHLPTFEAEIAACEKHHVELTAVWFPTTLNADARFILDALKKHQVKTQLWVMATGAAPKNGADPAQAIEAQANSIRPIAEEAGKIGCSVALYNHNGWMGEPENELAVLEKLNLPNVGMVYTLHHGHAHLDRFKDVLPKMLPHLYCITLNGMKKGPESILPLGQGDLDLDLLKTIRDGGYHGRIAILNHTDKDAEARLLDNLDGLAWLVAQLDGHPGGPKPTLLRSFTPATRPSAALPKPDYWAVEDPAPRELLPKYQVIPAAEAGDLTPTNGWPAAGEYQDWYRSHGNDGCNRYSPLAQIDRANVKSLKLAWEYHSGDGKGNIQCNPIIVDGVMYAPTVGNSVVAINAETGKEIWRFKCQGRPAHRGLTYHRGGDGRPAQLLFIAGTNLWSLDPATGKPTEGFGDGGRVAGPQCTCAPAVYKNVIVFPGFQKDVFGHDLATGRPLWVFNTIPTGNEPFADTWDKAQQGANDWGGMALDAPRGIAYVCTGSPKPNFIGAGHHGDNLFGNCVIAIDAQTGQRLWHFQEIRHDIWDLDTPAPPILVTIDHDGRKVDAVAAVTKIGNTLLLDRVTGKPLFPFRLRRAPVSKMPGEKTAPYQPDVELPEPFCRRTFTKDDVTNLSPENRESVMSRLDDVTMGWFTPFEVGKPLVEYGLHGGAEWTGACVDPATGLLYVTSNELPWILTIARSERPAVDETKLAATPGRKVYEDNCMACHGTSREGLNTAPSLLGLSQRLKEVDVTTLLATGRGIMPAAPQVDEGKRKILFDYLFDRDRPDVKPTVRPERPSYHDSGYPKLLDKDNYPGCKPPWGQLIAINLNTGKIAWKSPLGEYPELTKRGIPKTGTEQFGGAIVTAGGLVFAGGTRDIKFRAFDKETGEELWSHPLPFGGFAPPATYQVHGKQYVVIPATGGGKLATPMGDAYVAFALP